jgi:excisionase family DNA binding protein
VSAISTRDLATELGVTPRTVQRWARERTVPHLRVGRTIRFLPHHVEEIIRVYEQGVLEQRPEADVPNDRFRPYIYAVPMRRPTDAA